MRLEELLGAPLPGLVEQPPAQAGAVEITRPGL